MNLSSFHERNQILLEESRVLLDREPRYIGSSSRDQGAIFYALGSFDSKYLRREIFGGIKKIRKKSKKYFTWSLGNLLFMKEIYSEIESLLPLYFGAVQKGEEYEILMEDYSQNKKVLVCTTH